MEIGIPFFCDQYNNHRQRGICFAIQKNVAPAIKDFKVINSRRSVLTLEAKWFEIAFVNAHAGGEK